MYTSGKLLRVFAEDARGPHPRPRPGGEPGLHRRQRDLPQDPFRFLAARPGPDRDQLPEPARGPPFTRPGTSSPAKSRTDPGCTRDRPPRPVWAPVCAHARTRLAVPSAATWLAPGTVLPGLVRRPARKVARSDLNRSTTGGPGQPEPARLWRGDTRTIAATRPDRQGTSQEGGLGCACGLMRFRSALLDVPAGADEE